MSKIYICPTPIGNLQDITLRVLDTLRDVDLIACEDTRTSLKLLNHFNIKKPLTSFHKFNEEQKIPYILDKVRAGESVAIISDAGMPGISDPGERLIKRAIEENVDFEVLPGANAAITALVASGLDSENFYFVGFLKGKNKQKKEFLNNIKLLKATLIFYEAPHRLKTTLEDIYSVFGNRDIVIARELTKLYEELIRGELANIIESFDEITLKGEFVLLVHGAVDIEEEIDILGELELLISGGLTKSQAVKEVARNFNLPKNQVYSESLKL